ncbi:MAG TPA: carbamate kinase [Thermoleophilaceae bacterium]
MRVVAALGGNALLRRGEPAEAEPQRRHVAEAARGLAELARNHELVVTHGNGPQVGLLALQSAAYDEIAPYPFDVLGAESEGMVGYLLEQALRNELPDRQVAALLTQVLVDPHDPAFAAPTKPIGPVYDEATAHRLAADRGWTVRPDGDHWRRVVASPEPREVLELETIRTLVALNAVVICAGGGGIPVVRNGAGRLHGVEAVIDKDLSAALLALELDADALLLLTDVDGIQLDYGTPAARPLREATPQTLAELDLPAGSMGPKAEAALRFVDGGGAVAAIASLDTAAAALAGSAGTIVRRAPARVA